MNASQPSRDRYSRAYDGLLDRRLIDRFVARVDAALLACETRQEVPPTLH